MGDFLASSGGLGAIGTLAQGVGGFLSSGAAGGAAEAQYGAAATNAMIEASALSSQYKVGAINMILQAEAQRAEYESAAVNYELEGMGKRGSASMYDMQAALSLLNKANTLRSAASLGASALDAVAAGRGGGEQASRGGPSFPRDAARGHSGGRHGRAERERARHPAPDRRGD